MTDYNNKQQFSYNTVPTSQNSVQALHLVKERLVVPIIFIPGVMGSNLKVKPEEGKDENTDKVWRLDSETSVLRWLVWPTGGAEARKKKLDPNKTEVDSRGMYIDAATKDIAIIEQEYNDNISIYEDRSFDDYEEQINVMLQGIDNAKKNHPENILFGLRGERGWGAVSYISYGEFLDTLQTSLFDPSGNSPKLTDLIKDKSFILEEKSKAMLTFTIEEIKHCESFYLPVHAMGYNWLESNEMSAIRLKTLVEQTLPTYYKKRGKICDKVILVTHSMGGLVARYYTQALGGKDKVLGVINGVQPSTGAVAAYTRMKRGTEVNSTFIGKTKDYVTEQVLGKDAAEMTAVCAQAPGTLQLLPTPEYGGNWLTITDPDGTESHFGANPYTDIYLAKDKWWCACEPHLINPLNSKHDLILMQNDWNDYEKLIKNEVKPFNEAIANQYHPNTYVFFGIEDNDEQIEQKYLTYKKAHWQGSYIAGHELRLKKPVKDHIGAQNRLELNELKDIRTIETEHHDWVEGEVEDYETIIMTKIGNIGESYRLKPADGNGDGTVPQCSGEIPIDKIKARMHLPIGHEPAYQSEITQEFTLRAIVDILQQVKN